MKSLLIIGALASTVLAGSIGGAAAFPIKAIDQLSGSFSGTSPTGTSAVLPGPSDLDLFPVFASSNTDFFGFYIPFLGSYTIVASVQATFGDNVNLNSFLLYNSQADLTPGSAFSGAMYQTLVPGKYLALDRVTLDPGLYYLGVGATGVNPTPPSGYAGTLSKALSPVPLPASAPMFGAALLGLAGLGYAAKRKKEAATV